MLTEGTNFATVTRAGVDGVAEVVSNALVEGGFGEVGGGFAEGAHQEGFEGVVDAEGGFEVAEHVEEVEGEGEEVEGGGVDGG